MPGTVAIDELETKTSPPAGFAPLRLTVERFEQMIAAGVLGEGESVILWKGGLVEEMTKGTNHFYAVSALYSLLFGLRIEGFVAFQEQPLRLADDSMPEPDLVVARGTIRDYRGRIPAAGDVALIVEVADSSLAVDSGEVLEAYASRSIPAYWIVNLPKRRIEVYREPSGPSGSAGYRQCQQFVAGDSVPVVLNGVEVGRVAVDDILP